MDRTGTFPVERQALLRAQRRAQHERPSASSSPGFGEVHRMTTYIIMKKNKKNYVRNKSYPSSK